MIALEAAIRAVHFAATGLVFGSFVFLLCVADPVARDDGRHRLHRSAFCLAGWSVVAILGSGFAWIAVEAAAMSGQPFAAALDRAVLTAVVGDTNFGRVMALRLALTIVLGTFVFCIRLDGRGWPILVGTTASGVLLGMLAWTGHAAAERGPDRIVHLAADVLHLLAAGGWLGALPLLIVLLRWTPDAASAYRAARRFSALGIVCVAALILTGLVNGWYLVGSIPALLATAYGRLLLFKLALFAAMLALAAANRLRHMPGLVTGGSTHGSLARLRRNAILETALGLAVIAVVGELGATAPAMMHLHRSQPTASAPGLPHRDLTVELPARAQPGGRRNSGEHRP